MQDNPELSKLQENGRLILLHIRRGALIFGLTAAGLLLTQFFADVRLWTLLAILGVLSITVVGDLIRYLRWEREMKRAEKEQNMPTRPLVHSS
jgi:hypothetical protein